MPGTFMGLETARRGIKVHQHSLEITGHNLANASTPGYSRQEAILQTTDPYTNPTLNSAASPGQYGTGVEVTAIRRIRDEYLDNQVRRASTDAAYWEDQISILQRAEACFAEPGSEGIGQRMVDFFKAWMDLNNSPQDPGVKSAVVQLGEELASLMSYTYEQLGDIEKSVKAELSQQVDRVNDILVQIRDLTDSIKKVYSVGQQPNDLLDKRDQLLEELSSYGPLQVGFGSNNGKPNGELTQLTLFGQDVLTANTKIELVTTGGDINISFNGGSNNGETVYLTANCNDTNQGGSLLGLEMSRQRLIDYKSSLNDIAVNLRNKIVEKFNEPPKADYPVFFTGDLATGDFQVDSTLISNPALVDGTKARDIANLRDEEISSAKPFTFEEYYSILVTEVGGSAKGTSDMAGNQMDIRKQITALRDSVSGVSVDEELTRMIQFQYGFQASAKVISAIDEMLDVIINRLF